MTTQEALHQAYLIGRTFESSKDEQPDDQHYDGLCDWVADAMLKLEQATTEQGVQA